MEGHWERQKGAPFIILGFPDEENETNHFELEIPYASALILTHDINGETPGLKDVPPEDRPPVATVFWSFRVMIGIGTMMMLIGLVSVWLRYRDRLYTSRPFLHWATVMGPSGFIAVVAGWIVTEVGRQPFTIYGVLRTAESASPIEAPAVAASLLAFIVVYFLLFGAGVLYILRILSTSPNKDDLPTGQPTRAAGTTPAASMLNMTEVAPQNG